MRLFGFEEYTSDNYYDYSPERVEQGLFILKNERSKRSKNSDNWFNN